MKYCQHCGQEIHDEAVVCIHCGRSTNLVAEATAKTENDKNSPGLNILSFFIPIAGLILYCTNIKDKPICAKGCGIAALSGFVFNLFIMFIVGV